MQPTPSVNREQQFKIKTDRSELTNSEWESDYNELLSELSWKPKHPVTDCSKERLHEIKNTFMEIFDQAPVKEKKRLLQTPLFPKEGLYSDKALKFYPDKNKLIAATRPLAYILLCGDAISLKKIEPYLESDCLFEGPHQTTIFHVLIGGITKETISFQSDPSSCLEFLLTKYLEIFCISIKSKTTPLDLAKELLNGFSSTDSHQNQIEQLKQIIQQLEFEEILLQFKNLKYEISCYQPNILIKEPLLLTEEQQKLIGLDRIQNKIVNLKKVQEALSKCFTTLEGIPKNLSVADLQKDITSLQTTCETYIEEHLHCIRYIREGDDLIDKTPGTVTTSFEYVPSQNHKISMWKISKQNGKI